MKKVFVFLLCALIIFTGSFVLLSRQNEKEIFSESDKFISSQDIDLESKKINLLFVGDIMLARGVDYQMRLNNDYRFPFLKIASTTQVADLTIGNLEGPIVLNSEIVPINTMNFNFNSKVIEGLKFSGIDIVSLANNHLLDKGRAGLEQTKNFLSQAGIEYFGEPIGCDEKDVLKKDNFIFIGLNQTFPFNCGEEKILDLVRDIYIGNEEKILIVFLHWGEEYQPYSNQKQQKLGRALVDNGVHLVIGSHPHVIQEVEQYKTGWIVYSLGNFIFDQNFSKETMEGLIIKIGVENGKIREFLPKKIKINSAFQTELIEL